MELTTRDTEHPFDIVKVGKVGIAECSGTCSLSPVGGCLQGSNDLVAMDRPPSGGCNVKYMYRQCARHSDT